MNAFDKADGVSAAAASVQNQVDTMEEAAYSYRRGAVAALRRIRDRLADRPFMPGWDGSLRSEKRPAGDVPFVMPPAF